MSPKLIAISASVAIAALLGGTMGWIMMNDSRAGLPDCGGGQIAGGTLGGDFTLVNSAGQTVTDKDVITGPTIVYFGYTFCPDVCPLDSARNAAAVDILDEMGKPVTPIFISIDPARDTPEVVGAFAHNFHDRMIGLTGSDEQVAAASKAYRTFYQKQDGDPQSYLVDHSTFSYLVFPGLGVVDFFGHDETPEAVAERTACFVDAIG